MNVLLLNAFAASLFMDAEPAAAPAGSGPFQAVLMIFVVLIALVSQTADQLILLLRVGGIEG